MLDQLDHVDWASLRHAYGPAEDVPRLIRALASNDSAARDQALYELFGNIHHQGTIYPASAAALPFLYELLAEPSVERKSDIAMLVSSIADGVGYLQVHASSGPSEERWRGILSNKGLTLEGELAREASEVAAVRAAASLQLRDLLPYLNDEDGQVRSCVATALGRYPEHRDWSVAALRAAVERENDEEARGAMVDALKQLSGSTREGV